MTLPIVRVPVLPSDLLIVIFRLLELGNLVKSRCVCREWRANIDEMTTGVLATLGGALPETDARWITQTTLCAMMGLTPDVARTLPHTVEHHRGAMGPYTTHMFRVDNALRALVCSEGWTAMGVRLQTKTNRKRKRDQLDNRRAEAGAKRRARLEAWFASATPLGEAVITLDDWANARPGLHAALAKDVVLSKYLSTTVVTGPSLAAAKAATLAVDAALGARVARVDALRGALAVRGLERRADSRLCDAYEDGVPVGGFTTAEAVAEEMACMRWLHGHWLGPGGASYATTLEAEVRRLAGRHGHYYAGINAEARDVVKARLLVARPAVWPWLQA